MAADFLDWTARQRDSSAFLAAGFVDSVGPASVAILAVAASVIPEPEDGPEVESASEHFYFGFDHLGSNSDVGVSHLPPVVETAGVDVVPAD